MVNNNNFLNYSLKLCAILATFSLLTIGCSSEEPKTTSTTPRPSTTTTQKPASADPGAVVSGAPTSTTSSSTPAKTTTAKKPRTQNKKTGTIKSIVDDPSLYGAADPPVISRGTGKE